MKVIMRMKRRSVPPVAPSDRVPHVSVFAISNAFQYTEVKCDKFKGLLYAQIVRHRSTDDGWILTMWRDKEAFDAVSSWFLSETGLQAPMCEGIHLDFREPRKSVWRRLTIAQLWAAVASLLLIGQNLHNSWTGYQWLVGRPSIETSAAPTVVDALVGEPFQFDLHVKNTRQEGNCDILFSKLSSEPPDAMALEPLAARHASAVEPNKDAVLSVKARPLRDGRFKVKINGQATTGFIPQHLDIAAQIDVRVWRALSWESRGVRQATADGKLCEADFVLSPGKHFSLGLDTEARLDRSPGVRFVAVRFPGVQDFTPLQVANTPGKEVATLTWRTPEIKEMREVSFTLILAADQPTGKTRPEWEVLAQSIRFGFDQSK